ncbi:Protein CBR-SRD-47 [Caenorhabditis briggsae]|uniref:Protein CBR-SRD-47 n=1 Tax=Caenorhabditis briggsae TaxID=6238 RepID=A8WZJ4_CAEBR|nr:Protein CBR-SRD-47 [Caenorhabditis briggsae]CAP25804.2 Protein CBR-SRD-47 [Caenorhabditis briggsae]
MHREILSILFPTLFCIVLPSQVLLMYMIQYYSPKFLNNLKSILRCNCLLQFITLLIACSLQTRQVSNLTPIEIWCYGYVKDFDPTILYSLYFLSQSTTLASVLLTFLTIYLKFDVVRNMNKSSNQKYIVTFILLIPVVVVTGAEIFLIITKSLASEYQEKLLKINLKVTDHSVIGFITLQTIPSQAIFLCIIGPVFILPPIGFLIRRKFVNIVSATLERTTSTNRKQQNQSFINGLTIQVFLPIVCYLPMFIYLFIVIETKTESLFEQYFIGIFSTFPSLLDSYITSYSVKTYRKQIKILFKLEKAEQPIVVAAIVSQM